jgi:hypothetical protein
MFNGSYIQVILDIAETDPHCKLSFVKSDLENARKELAELQSRPTQRAADGACPNCGNVGRITRYDIEQCDKCGFPSPAAKA